MLHGVGPGYARASNESAVLISRPGGRWVVEVAMEFPNRDVAEAWVGRTLVDRDGVEIGACTQVFFDDATRVTEWVCSEVAGAAVVIPAVGAAESDDTVRVTVSRDDVTRAPSVGDAQHVSAEDEAALYRHYGMSHSREASPTVLPTGDAEPPTVGSESQEEQGRPGQPAQSTGARGRIAAAVGALAGIGVAVAVAQRVRRLRQRPLSRRQRLARRGRAASAAIATRGGRIAASAAPVLVTAKQVVRRGAPAGAAAAGVPAAAALLGAVRRRRSAVSRMDDQD
jgi:hypothetical protein